MMTPVDDGRFTRWDELCKFVRLIVKIATIFNPIGVDIYFLNQDEPNSITQSSKVEELFKTRPGGYTPLASVLRKILQSTKYHRSKRKKMLAFIATNGAPTDDQGNPNLLEFTRLIEHEITANAIHVMFLMCTDDSEAVDYFRDLDENMSNADVTDDYQTQKKKIRDKHGEKYPFSYADYVVKILVGAIDGEINSKDD